MTDWTINNNKLVTYRFPDGFVLPSGSSVRVWTKHGTDTNVELYWRSEEEIWGDDDGVAYLRDHTETLIDSLDR